MILSWIFAGLMILGGSFFVFSLLLGGVGDSLGDMFHGLDSALESIGLDLIPDSFEHGSGGAGCITILAFITGFGAAGLVASLFGANALICVLAGILFGVIVGGIYAGITKLIMSQQSNSSTTDADIVGKTAHITVEIPKGGVGQVMLTTQGGTRPYPACCVNNQAVVRGQSVKVISVEGGRLYVEKVE
ncbi:MAG: NfeD family protein [Patescibacteria group bacterium]|nr:hypothetical protein [Patescibacteria group bacterium]MBU1952680.1 hypothetical protein [Patescibacteria group bacterium]